jgi:selenocysteine-specific elongation factor
MPIVGTAGHVDHGKSTLVRALTGIDPDRWAEEKERGLTIDLGFAWTDLDGRDVGFVDVPGHERFIKNMLAGVGAIDCALFVVAADSGWMPQSEEHATVLDLLGIDRGVVALSRIDLVDDETRELAMLEVLEEVEGTSLEGWPVVGVSPVTGEGLDELRDAISDVLAAAPQRQGRGFRMWVDRAFRPSGAGLVVTGTVLEGSVAGGDQVIVLPQGVTATVRGVQHHGHSVDVSGAGSRTAVNLTGAPDATDRGTLLTGADVIEVTDRMLVGLRAARAFDEVPARGAFHVHLGTASAPATIRRIGSTEGYLVTLAEPVPATSGDRLILRDSGRRTVVAGGVVLDPSPSARPDTEDVEVLAAAAMAPLDDRAEALVRVHGMVDGDRLRRSSGGGRPTTAIRAGSMWVATGRIAALASQVVTLVGGHHEQHPMRPGIPKGELASRLGVPIDVIDAVVARTDGIEERSGFIADASFHAALDAEAEAEWRRVRVELERSFDVPNASSLGLDAEAVHLLVRNGELVRISDDVLFSRDQADAIVERVAELDDGFTVADFRDHFGMARRQAVPTLEWLDAIGRTRRSGDGRSVRG